MRGLVLIGRPLAPKSCLGIYSGCNQRLSRFCSKGRSTKTSVEVKIPVMIKVLGINGSRISSGPASHQQQYDGGVYRDPDEERGHPSGSWGCGYWRQRCSACW